MKKVKPCKSKHILFGVDTCAGCTSHKGHHWCYDKDGSLIQWRNESDPKSKNAGSKLVKKYGGFGSSNTPPDHASYIHPKVKMKHAYRWLQFKHLKQKKTPKKRHKIVVNPEYVFDMNKFTGH